VRLTDLVRLAPGTHQRRADEADTLSIAANATELGYRAQVAFDDGLASTIEWYHANRDWWEPLKARAAGA
jgi:dTDP-glucose 4,6-dehydratase